MIMPPCGIDAAGFRGRFHVFNASWAGRAGAVLVATASVGAFAAPAFAAYTDGAASVSGTTVRFVAGDKVANGGPTRVDVKVYDRNDSVWNNSGLPTTAEGGSGNDRPGRRHT